jgi:serine/threonine protein phosphatase PrpC
MKDEDGEYVGPLRVYMKEKDIPGLAMTRSFGDYFASTAGVISEPEVTEYYFKEEDRFIILASDGLFEFMDNEEIVKIVKNYYEKNDIVGCCEFLYKESASKWLREEEDIIDDITIILVFFENIYR